MARVISTAITVVVITLVWCVVSAITELVKKGMKNLSGIVVLLTCLFCACSARAQNRPVVGPFIVVSPSSSASTVPLTVTAADGQISNALEVKDGNGDVVASVTPEGVLNGQFAIDSATPNAMLFTDTSGIIAPTPLVTYDAVNNKLNIGLDGGLNVASPLSLTSFFTAADEGPGSFTWGLFPNIDVSSWNRSRVRFGSTLFDDPSNNTAWTINVQGGAAASGSAASYERGGILVQMGNADPSTALIARDVVGIDSRCYIATGNLTGRCWGMYADVQVQTGADGNTNAAEFGVNNAGGIDQPLVDQNTSKDVLGLVAGECTSCTAITAYIRLAGGGATAHKGLVARASDFTASTVNDRFLELMRSAADTDLFAVKPTGQMFVGDLRNTANLSDYTSTVYGIAAFREQITVTDGRQGGAATDNKNVLVLYSSNSDSKHIIGGGVYDTSVNGWPVSIYLTTSGTATGHEFVLFKTNDVLQFTANAAASGNCAGSTTASFRNNAGSMELCNNAGGWSPILTSASAPASGWTDGGANVYNTTQNDRVMIGLSGTIGDWSNAMYDGSLAVNQQIYAVQAGASNADNSVVGMAWRSGDSKFVFGTGRTGAGTYRDLVFTAGGSDRGELFQSTGNWTLGGTADNGYKLEVTGTTNITGAVTAASFSGSGAGLTGITTAAGWTDAGVNVYNTTQTDRVMVGLGSSTGDFSSATYDGTLIGNQAIYVSDGNVTNGSLGGLIYDTGSNTVRLASGRSSAGGTYRPLAFIINGTTEAARFTTDPIWLFGTTTGSDATRIISEWVKNQNDSTNLMVLNTTSGTSGRAALIARSQGAAAASDISVGITSNSYTTASGLAANTGFIVTDADASNGLLLHTEAGGIDFQVGGSTSDCTLSTAGLMTCTSFSGSGASLTSLNAANISSGTLVIARGGTNNTSFTSGRLDYYNGSSLASTGVDYRSSSDSLVIRNSGSGIYFANTADGVGTGLFGTGISMDGYIAGSETFAWVDNSSSTTVSSIYVKYNGALEQVKTGDCTVAGGTHKCLYVN